MKQQSLLGAAAFALALTLGACDNNIDEQDRFIPVEDTHTERVVLIEEFTGTRCPNCPTGAERIAALHEYHGNKVIPVSLFPDQPKALTKPWDVDLRTTVASDIFNQYNKDNALPAAMFNRVSNDGAVLSTSMTLWSNYVSNILEDENDTYAPADITLTPNYNPETRNLTVQYNCFFTKDINEDVSFQVYILENGIVGTQSTSTAKDNNYVFNHVLRTALNGTWGKDFGGGHLVGESVEGTAGVTLDESWEADNIQVVGFLCYTGGNRTVLHAALVESITK